MSSTVSINADILERILITHPATRVSIHDDPKTYGRIESYTNYEYTLKKFIADTEGIRSKYISIDDNYFRPGATTPIDSKTGDPMCSSREFKSKYKEPYVSVKESENKKKMEQLEKKYKRLLEAVSKKRKLKFFEGLLIGLAFYILFNLLVDNKTPKEAKQEEVK